MLKILLTLATVFMSVLAGMALSFEATAADAAILATGRGRVAMGSPYCQYLWRCSPAGCERHRVCTRPCPDRYSCYPLYGAYGPYGGVAYWGGYTDSGWGYRR